MGHEDVARDSLGKVLPMGKTEDDVRIAKMDRVAESLLALITLEKTTDTQKGRFFAQVISWYKIRPTLIPSSEGGKLEEMSRGIKSAGGKRSGSARSAGRRAGQSRAIKDIIASLPKPGSGQPSSGQRPANGGDSDGDPPSFERESGGASSAGGGVFTHSGGNDSGDNDELSNRSVL